MCDEYDDERMRLLWRRLADQDGLVLLPTETADAATKPNPLGLGSDAEPRKARPRALTR